MNVLVVGGAGFVGSHVVDACRAKGWRVLVLDSLDPGAHRQLPTYLRQDVEYCVADLRHWTPDERFCEVEAVVHLAALGGVGRAIKEPANIISANAGGTARLAYQALAWPNLQRFILVSSFSIYGTNYRYRCPACYAETGAERREADLQAGRFDVYCPVCGTAAQVLPIGEETSPNPLEVYGASKYMQELALRNFPADRLTILRPSSIYGDRLRVEDSEATIIAKLAGWITSGQRPNLFEDGQQIRDWVHVQDLVDGVLKILEGAPAAPVINICAGEPTTLQEACDLIQQAAGVACPPRVVGGFRPGDMRHCLGDVSRFQALLGRPPLPFREGVAVLANYGKP